MQCIITENSQFKLTHNDDTKKMAHDSVFCLILLDFFISYMELCLLILQAEELQLGLPLK